MKPLVLRFVGGDWDGKTLRTDSPDYEEQLLASGCYEISHHGAVGGVCAALSNDALRFAKGHGWVTFDEDSAWKDNPYSVVEHRETETEITVTFKFHPVEHA